MVCISLYPPVLSIILVISIDNAYPSNYWYQRELVTRLTFCMCFLKKPIRIVQHGMYRMIYKTTHTRITAENTITQFCYTVTQTKSPFLQMKNTNYIDFCQSMLRFFFLFFKPVLQTFVTSAKWLPKTNCNSIRNLYISFMWRKSIWNTALRKSKRKITLF